MKKALNNRAGSWITQPQGYKAFIPASLPPNPPLRIEGDLITFLSEADRALARLDGMCRVLPNPDLFVAMYIRKEAVLSSQIEGTQSSLEDVLEFEAGNPPRVNDVNEVVNYIKAMNYGLERLKELPLSLRLIKEIHKILLEGVRGGERMPGEFRTTQNWIGPPGCTLNEAVFVPPPPQEVVAQMGKLEKFFYDKQPMPPLVKAALIHYQFETIHPFIDGNGRIGRLLITFYLTWTGILERPLLYLSYYFKKHRQEYYDWLMKVREEGDFEGWLRFFLKGVIEISNQSLETARKILSMQQEHRQLLAISGIASPMVINLLDILFQRPVIRVKDVQETLKTSYQNANKIVSRLVSLEILKEITGQKRNRQFVYEPYRKILAEGTHPGE
jgi:Fic family protein